MVAGRLVSVALLLGLVVAPLSCGGRSLSREEGSEAGAGGSGGSSDPQGGTNASGGKAGNSSGGGGTSSGGSGPSSGGNGPGGAGSGAGTPARGGTGNDCNPGLPRPGGTGAASNGLLLLPSCEGWLDRADNTLGIQGGWYPFGDQYPDHIHSRCIDVGQHAPEDCSIVHSPPPYPALGFPQAVRGEMCTSGEVAFVLPCPPTIMTAGCPAYDYWNMTGAGIAVDFNAEKSEDGGARHPWDPSTFSIIGFSFEIDQLPQPSLRVEIPMVLTDEEAVRFSLRPGATTDEHPDGSPYWGASYVYPPSPVALGVNRVLWTDIRPPRADENYVFDTRRMLGIQFHVPTSATPPKAEYAFCIKNLTLLRQ